MDQVKKTGLGTASMVLGIIGLSLGLLGTLCVISILGFVFGIVLYAVAIILGVLGFIFGLVSTIKKQGGKAIAGLVMSSIIVVAVIIAMVLAIK